MAILEDTTGLRDATAASGESELVRVQVQLGKLKKAEGNYRHALWVLFGLGYTESNPLFKGVKDGHKVLLEQLGTQ